MFLMLMFNSQGHLLSNTAFRIHSFPFINYKKALETLNKIFLYFIRSFLKLALL